MLLRYRSSGSGGISGGGSSGCSSGSSRSRQATDPSVRVVGVEGRRGIEALHKLRCDLCAAGQIRGNHLQPVVHIR